MTNGRKPAGASKAQRKTCARRSMIPARSKSLAPGGARRMTLDDQFNILSSCLLVYSAAAWPQILAATVCCCRCVWLSLPKSSLLTHFLVIYSSGVSNVDSTRGCFIQIERYNRYICTHILPASTTARMHKYTHTHARIRTYIYIHIHTHTLALQCVRVSAYDQFDILSSCRHNHNTTTATTTRQQHQRHHHQQQQHDNNNNNITPTTTITTNKQTYKQTNKQTKRSPTQAKKNNVNEVNKQTKQKQTHQKQAM